MRPRSILISCLSVSLTFNALLASSPATWAGELLAGVAKLEITDREAGPVHDPSFVKVLVLKSGETAVALVTIDAVAIGEIGRIGNQYLGQVRTQLQAELGIPPASVIVNASHCHSIPRRDTAAITIQAAKEAWRNLAPVKAGVGLGREDRISENRRLRMQDGSEIDMRRAYAMPRDEDIAGVGPIDPQIGILRLDRQDGRPLAVLYNFACHPILNPPHQGNSADFPGYASQVIEEGMSGATALFVQGCAGDINPVRYKELGAPPDAEPLGNLLGLSVLRAARKIDTQPEASLAVVAQTISLPRGTDLARRITLIEKEQARLLASLRPTNINFKTFLPLFLGQRIWPEFPSHYAQSYLHDRLLGRDGIARQDTENRASVDAYLQNIAAMEQLTRLNTNLSLLKMHLAQNEAAGTPNLDAEVRGFRVGDFKLVTFPGELTVQIGLNIKQAAKDPHAFVAGYTNGYLYYTPTAQQRLNSGFAQEDCDSLVGPEWQQIFETKAIEVLGSLK